MVKAELTKRRRPGSLGQLYLILDRITDLNQIPGYSQLMTDVFAQSYNSKALSSIMPR